MRYVILALLSCLSLIPMGSIAGAQLTPRQQALFEVVVQNDLSAYLQGGDAVLQEDWSKVAVPWETDQQIGMRYSGGNALSADSFYGQKTIFMRGRYLSAENWVDDDYRVQLFLVAAIVRKPDAAFLASARNNTPVEMACKVKGLEFDTAYVEDCVAPEVAVSRLVGDEMDRVTTRLSKNDKSVVWMVRAIDENLSADDPCRTDMSGCINKVSAILASAVERAKKGEPAR